MAPLAIAATISYDTEARSVTPLSLDLIEHPEKLKRFH